MPESEKELAWIALCSTRRLDGRFFISSNRSCRAATCHLFAEGLDLDLAARRGPAAAGGADLRLRHQLRRHAEPDAGRGGVLDQLPAVIILAAAHRDRERPALLRGQDAGLVELVAPLERAHGGDRAVAEFGIDRSRQVAGPDQVGLDRDAARRPAAPHRQPAAPALRAAAASRGLFLGFLGRVFLGCRLFGRLSPSVLGSGAAGPPAQGVWDCAGACGTSASAITVTHATARMSATTPKPPNVRDTIYDDRAF